MMFFLLNVAMNIRKVCKHFSYNSRGKVSHRLIVLVEPNAATMNEIPTTTLHACDVGDWVIFPGTRSGRNLSSLGTTLLSPTMSPTCAHHHHDPRGSDSPSSSGGGWGGARGH